MNYLLAILAGFVQGLTEFLPISSTGHLIIFENLFHISQQEFGLAFDASLHLGTLLAVSTFFYKDYLKILNPKNPLLLKLIIGTIPAVAAGLLFENYIETNLRQVWLVGSFLIIYSLVLYQADRFGKQNKDGKSLTLLQSLAIGIFQAIALIPGVSRSGSTISAGLFLGLKRQDAARFAFMLSGPIVAGAGLKKFAEVINSQSIQGQDLNFFIIGIISSAIFGFLTIKFLLKYLSSHNLNWFIGYRVILGILLIVWSLLGT